MACGGWRRVAGDPAWIIGLDAATFAMLALQTGRTNLPAASAPVPAAGDTRQGLSILRRQPDLLALLVVTWLFNLAFGPAETGHGTEIIGGGWVGVVIGPITVRCKPVEHPSDDDRRAARAGSWR